MLTQLQLGRDFFLRQEIAFSTMPLAPSDPLTTTNISFLVVNVSAIGMKVLSFLWPTASLFYYKEPIACCLYLKLCEKKISFEVNLSKQNACCEASENIRYDTLRQAWKMLRCNYR